MSEGDRYRVFDFNARWRGWARAEVEATLRAAADRLDAVVAERDAARAEAANASATATALMVDVAQLGRMFQLAQETAERAVAEATQEAERLRAQAESQAATVRARAHDQAGEVLADAERRAEALLAEARHVLVTETMAVELEVARRRSELTALEGRAVAERVRLAAVIDAMRAVLAEWPAPPADCRVDGPAPAPAATEPTVTLG